MLEGRGALEYEYWGCVETNTKTDCCKEWTGGRFYETQISNLPEWVKIKMAMLDFMNDLAFLPCGSHKTTFANETRYYLYKSEDERKKS